MGADQSKEEEHRYRSTIQSTIREHRAFEEAQEQRQREYIYQRQREIYQARLAGVARASQPNYAVARDYSAVPPPAPVPAPRVYPNLDNVNSNANNARAVSTDSFVFINRSQPSAPSIATETGPQTISTSRAQPTAPSNETGTRPKTTTRPRKKASNNDNSQLNCPICNNSFGIEIYQCANGHSACEGCKQANARCVKPECRLHLTDIRNRALEAYVAELVEPCYNSNDGCKLYFKLAEMDLHLKECPFNEMPCPLASIFGRCTWRGKLSQLESHFDDVHPENRQANIDSELCLFNLCDDHQIIYLVTLGVFNFLVGIKISKGTHRIFLTVQMIGTQHSASKWDYEFHVYNKRQPRRKFQYGDICHSTGNSFNEIFRDMNCVNLPLSYAMTFVNEGTLTYKFFIKKNEEFIRPRGNRTRGRGRGRPRSD